MKNDARMNTSHRTVSTEAMEAEWEEIKAAKINPAAFRPLYNRYYQSIFRYIYKRTTEESLTADICSQVFMKAMKKIEGYSYQGVPFSAWLFRIASNEVAQHYRSTKKHRVVSVEDANLSDMMEEIEEGNSQNRRQYLLASLEELKQKDLEIIELRKKILKSSESQLKNGVITSSAYITEVTNLFEAENSLSTHKTEMLLEKANYNTLKGN